jgi:RNA 2',3'-cyclic 3'-phosphodiesterase
VRAFVAIEVDERTSPEKPTIAPSHLTLRFLGELDPTVVPAVVTALRAAAKREVPFGLTLDGIGAFPSRAAPRVVWVGVSDGRDDVVRLANEISDALVPIGVVPDPPTFVPHVTLFRVRSPADRHRARGLLDGLVPSPSPRRVRVTEFVLLESVLTAGGAVHRPVERFPLSGRRGAAG